MEDIKIVFQRTRETTEKAVISFVKISKKGKAFRRYSFPAFFAIVFLYFWISILTARGVFSATREPYAFTAFLFDLSLPIFYGLVIGWFLSVLLRTIQQNLAIEGLRETPSKYFGKATIAIGMSGLTVKSPLVETKYEWEVIDSIFTTSDYIFFCNGIGFKQRLLTWIPLNILGSQSQVIKSQIEEIYAMATLS